MWFLFWVSFINSPTQVRDIQLATTGYWSRDISRILAVHDAVHLLSTLYVVSRTLALSLENNPIPDFSQSFFPNAGDKFWKSRDHLFLISGDIFISCWPDAMILNRAYPISVSIRIYFSMKFKCTGLCREYGNKKGYIQSILFVSVILIISTKPFSACAVGHVGTDWSLLFGRNAVFSCQTAGVFYMHTLKHTINMALHLLHQ